jgi:hypothetical protein
VSRGGGAAADAGIVASLRRTRLAPPSSNASLCARRHPPTLGTRRGQTTSPRPGSWAAKHGRRRRDVRGRCLDSPHAQECDPPAGLGRGRVARGPRPDPRRVGPRRSSARPRLNNGEWRSPTRRQRRAGGGQRRQTAPGRGATEPRQRGAADGERRQRVAAPTIATRRKANEPAPSQYGERVRRGAPARSARRTSAAESSERAKARHVARRLNSP